MGSTPPTEDDERAIQLLQDAFEKTNASVNELRVALNEVAEQNVLIQDDGITALGAKQIRVMILSIKLNSNKEWLKGISDSHIPRLILNLSILVERLADTVIKLREAANV